MNIYVKNTEILNFSNPVQHLLVKNEGKQSTMLCTIAI